VSINNFIAQTWKKFYFPQNLENGIVLNVWFSSVHRYLFYPNMAFGACNFQDLRGCQFNFLFYAYFFRSEEVFAICYISSQFHQHFSNKFFVPTSFWQLFSSYMYIEKAAKTIFVRKICT